MRLAWSLWGLAMALEVTGIALWLDNHAALVDRFGATEDARPHVFVVPGYTTVGAVIAARTRNRIGWLFLGFGLIAALMVFTSPYHDRGVLIAPGSLPAADLVGQLGSAVSAGVLLVAQVSLAAMALAPLQRFRHADQVQRQQLKWFAFVVGACLAILLAAGASRTVLPIAAGVLVWVASVGVLAGIPVAVAVAILRYRKYDIDRLISRALAYAVLTVVLGLGYGGLVLALGQLFGTVGERTPSWAVAASTLAVAALFQPARRRIQQAVDRRLNRRRYDEIDLDTLAAELHAVVDQTVQPTRASLWLRTAPNAAAAPTGQPRQ